VPIYSMFKKGNIPWNKRLTKETNQTIKQAGRQASATMRSRGHMKGEKNPMFSVHRVGKNAPHYGRKHSDITKRLLSKYRLDYYKTHTHPSTGKKRKDVSKRNTNRKGKTYEEIYGVVRAQKVKDKIAASEMGDKSHFWNGGTSYEPYDQEFNRLLKEKIKKRDGYICQICYLDGQLHTHHIDYDKTNNREDNLISLCPSCHSKTNFDRVKWMKLLKVKICEISER